MVSRNQSFDAYISEDSTESRNIVCATVKTKQDVDLDISCQFGAADLDELLNIVERIETPTSMFRPIRQIVRQTIQHGPRSKVPSKKMTAPSDKRMRKPIKQSKSSQSVPLCHDIEIQTESCERCEQLQSLVFTAKDAIDSLKASNAQLTLERDLIEKRYKDLHNRIYTDCLGKSGPIKQVTFSLLEPVQLTGIRQRQLFRQHVEASIDRCLFKKHVPNLIIELK